MQFQEGQVYIYNHTEAYIFTNIRRLGDRDGVRVDLVRVSDGQPIPGYSCASENYYRWKKRDKLKLIRKEYAK